MMNDMPKRQQHYIIDYLAIIQIRQMPT